MRVIVAVVDKQIHVHELDETINTAKAHEAIINHYRQEQGRNALIRQQVMEVEELPDEI